MLGDLMMIILSRKQNLSPDHQTSQNLHLLKIGIAPEKLGASTATEL